MCKEQNLLVYDESLSGVDGLVVVADTGLLAGLLSIYVLLCPLYHNMFQHSQVHAWKFL